MNNPNETQPDGVKLVLPGHMKKAMFRLEELARRTDLVLLVLDSRAPRASESPVIGKILSGIPTVRILAKADLVPKAAVRSWARRFGRDGLPAIPFSKGKPPRVGEFLDRLESASGIPLRGKKISRALVAGIPNTGKSTLINFLLGRRTAPVGARPGVTKGFQLLKIRDAFYLYDTPGILPTRCETEADRHTLALIGALQDSEFDPGETARHLYAVLIGGKPELLRKYLGRDVAEAPPDFGAFCEQAARNCGFLTKGGGPDSARLARRIIDDFALGRMGKLALETPGEENERRT
ncbi:MAG: GTPase [bacterium]